MADRRLRLFATGAGPIIALVLLLFVSLTLMSDATENSARFGEMYSLLLVINALGIVTLGAAIGWNLIRLINQVRGRVPGARLTARMVAMFVFLAVTPVLVVYYFSLQFLHRGIDSWFDVRIEQALDDALVLSRASLGVRMREHLKQTELVAADHTEVSGELAAVRLDDARLRLGASELTLMTANGHIIASSSADPTEIIPHSPDDATLLQVRQSQTYIGLDPIADAGLHIRVVVQVPNAGPATDSRMLQALYPVAERMSVLAESVQSAYGKYKELAYLRKPLKTSFTLTLSLVLLLSILAAVWAAFFSARRVVAPLRDLVQGTQAVAEGAYETQLPQTAKDEVGFLLESFNEMTRKLARARDETRHSQRLVEEHRTYLEAVLSRMSSGVLTLDHLHRLVTVNNAAGLILGADFDADLDRTLEEIAATHPHLRPLAEAVGPHLEDTSKDWREEVTLFGASGHQALMCRGTPLPGSDHPVPGHIMVFDDITALIQAERNAAWSEVARRLAHEIKNPLTPIQLSAERLRHKYLGKMPANDANALDSLTRTIVQQVKAIKEMVNAFSEYARSPEMHPKMLNLNKLITDVAELYRLADTNTMLETHLEAIPKIKADPDHLRQVLHNLIKNALEASATASKRVLYIESRCVKDSTRDYIDLRFIDQGAGFPQEILEHVFEPYVTTKRKGTGLGLAIVQKIVQEHGGMVWAENNPSGGATVVLRFPIAVSDRAESTTTRSRRETAL